MLRQMNLTHIQSYKKNYKHIMTAVHFQSPRHTWPYTLAGPCSPPTSTYRGHKLVGFPGPQRWVLIDLLDGGRRPVGVTVGADGGLGLPGEEEHSEV